VVVLSPLELGSSQSFDRFFLLLELTIFVVRRNMDFFGWFPLLLFDVSFEIFVDGCLPIFRSVFSIFYVALQFPDRDWPSLPLYFDIYLIIFDVIIKDMFNLQNNDKYIYD
jgi:hypothetical protein